MRSGASLYNVLFLYILTRRLCACPSFPTARGVSLRTASRPVVVLGALAARAGLCCPHARFGRLGRSLCSCLKWRGAHCVLARSLRRRQKEWKSVLRFGGGERSEHAACSRFSLVHPLVRLL